MCGVLCESPFDGLWGMEETRIKTRTDTCPAAGRALAEPSRTTSRVLGLTDLKARQLAGASHHEQLSKGPHGVDCVSRLLDLVPLSVGPKKD